MNRNRNYVISNIDDLFDKLIPSEDKKAITKELIEHRILLPILYNEYDDLCRLRLHLEKPDIAVLILIITTRCNLRCKYCYFEQNLSTSSSNLDMSKEVAQKGLDVFIKSISSKGANNISPKIILYGGEPILNLSIILNILSIIETKKKEKKLPENTEIILNTNGTLIDEKVANIIKDYNISVILSLDGPQIFHDHFRKDSSGKGSFKSVIKSLEIMQRKKISVNISTTITYNNIDNLEGIIHWMKEDIGVNYFGFNLLLDSLGYQKKNIDEYARKSAEKLVSCYKICQELGVYEEKMMRRAKAFIQGYTGFSDCAGCGQQIVIDPEGGIGVCHAFMGLDRYFVKKTEKIDPSNHKYWKEWRLRSPISMPQCIDCIALGICGGGCPYNAFINTKSIWKLDKINCDFTKKLLDYFLENLIDRKLSKCLVSNN